MDNTGLLDIDSLLNPIPGTDPGGEDMSFTSEFDQIREARRSDDPNLAQGAWEIPLKSSDWPKVLELSQRVLSTKSKDLQAALWLTEALTHLHGVQGFSLGLDFTRRLLDRYWDHLYPRPEDGSFEERSGKLAWFFGHFPGLIRLQAVVRPDFGGYTLRDWQDALTLENLAARDPAAYHKALADGKASRESIEKGIRLSGSEHLRHLHRDSQAGLDSLTSFCETVDRLFGDDAPSMRPLREALEEFAQVIDRFFKEAGLSAGLPAPETTHPPSLSRSPSPPGESPPHGSIRSRAEALAKLREVAEFFRATEPHSPVAYLADKAARWGALSLDQWLRAVIKDQAVLGQLEETLGLLSPGPTDHGSE